MKKQKRGTPKRRRPKPRKLSLAVRDPAGRLHVFRPEVTQPIAAPLALAREPIMVASFVGTLKLTGEQIAALRRPVEESELDWRSVERDGPPILPYLSHNGYRDRLDAAFGLGGWGMVPVGMPVEKDSAIYTPFALVIDGVPRVYAWGEQQLHKMTFGDGLEGAKSNAITRCGKELGIARELWDRKKIAELQARRRGAGRTAMDGPAPGSAAEPSYGSDAKAGEPITDPQRIRLWTIVKKTGRAKTEVAMWIAARYKVRDSHQIKRRDYAEIVSAIEKPGPLPAPEGE